MLHGKIATTLLDDDIVATSLISMYGKCGNPVEAKAVFDGLRQRKLSLDTGVWNAILKVYGIQGDSTTTERLFTEMLNSGVVPNHLTLNSVLNALSHGGRPDAAVELFSDMEKRFGLQPQVSHYNCVVDALGRAGRLDEAERVIKGMTNPKPNFITWIALLGACRWYSDKERAAANIHNARNLVASADQAAALAVLEANILAESGDFKAQAKVLQEMKNKGLKKVSGKTWVEVDGKTHCFIAHDRSHPLTHQIYAELGILEQELRASGYIPDTRFVGHEVSEEEKECILCHHSEKIALTFALITQPKGPILMRKNLRMCRDCHSATALISQIRQRSIHVRDANRHHQFQEGKCSCNNYW